MDTVPETFAESLGLWLGYLVGPVFGAGSLLRRSRVFHPDGPYVFSQFVRQKSERAPGAEEAWPQITMPAERHSPEARDELPS